LVLKNLFNKYKAAQMITLWAAFFYFSPSAIFAQENKDADTDSDSAYADSVATNRHSPRTATIMSTFVPGLGQIYNRKYWKVPVIYGGMTACILAFRTNNDWRLHYHSLYSATPEEKEKATAEYLYYERKRELNMFLFFGLYVMNIIDATVDGYLFDFDVTKSLSLHFSPVIYQPQTVGIMCNFRF